MSAGTGCGCGPSRRSVVRATAAGLALGAISAVTSETFSARYAFASSSAGVAAAGAATVNGDVLVVLSLRGGFDGLSAVVPAGDPDYLRLRPTIGIPTSRLLPLNAMFGLHPALAPLLPLWQSGTFGVVHAVGQADPTRSHFEAMAEMERAAPGTSLRTGWLDRTIGALDSGARGATGGTNASSSPFQATQIGWGGLTGALAGPNPELVLSRIDDFELSGAGDAAERRRWATALTAMHHGAPAPLATAAHGALGAIATTTSMKDAGYAAENGATYPDNDLGNGLRDVARLIKAGVGLQVACLDQGDWDMHVDMGTPDSGRLKDNLAELAGGIAAFVTDLGAQRMQGVTLVTLSEFGRRVEQNGSGGVDHGHGNAVLMVGGGVAGGQVYGTWPGLSDKNLVDGDLAGAVDYRTILAEILQKRCGLGSLSKVFPGFSATPLGVARARA